MEAPSQEAPLIYNLFGSKNDDESLILDYEDVFHLIAYSTNPEGLPDKLRAALSKIRLFIFVGFSFDRWYTQLMLRLLCGSSGTQKYAANQQAVPDDTRDFLVHQFQIEFLDPEESFLDLLHAKAQEKGLLRPLADPLGDAEVAVVRFVQNGEIDRALQQLETLNQEEATLLMARYSQWRDSQEKGTLDSRDLLVEYNRIVDAVLEVLKEGKG
ncbi:MAG: SIR2 family protein [Bacteroidota bacterium]